ncbi:MAG: hypothetical protein IT223_11510 [Crocinitomicaceae bacterium]|nr:hypothetical protein [Crocinitomicaceae bacterium]
MNKHILLSAAFIISVTAYGQSTLAFNQVKLVSTVETVPTGKVWKVVSAIGASTSATQNSSSYSTSPSLPSDHIILINGNSAAIISSIGLSTSYSGAGSSSSSQFRIATAGKETCTELPIWLPADATLAAGSNVSLISVIEFDVN